MPNSPSGNSIQTTMIKRSLSKEGEEEKFKSPHDGSTDLKFSGQERIVSYGSLFRYATRFEVFLDFVGCVAAAAAGTAIPLLALFFGNLTQSLVDFVPSHNQHFGTDTPLNNSESYVAAREEFKRNVARNASALAGVGLGVLVCTYVYMVVWTYTGEKNARRIREGYFSAVIHQDLGGFDEVGVGVITSRIQNDTDFVQQATSEKVGIITQHVSAFASGFIVAYIRSWRLALVLTFMVVWVIVQICLMSRFLPKNSKVKLESLSEASSVAQEGISNIRTTQAFGLQKKILRTYEGVVSKAKEAGIAISLISSLGYASLYFLLYAAYALGFWYGARLVISGKGTLGDIVTVLASIQVGSVSIMFIAPELQVIANGRTAATKLFSAIDRKPFINSRSSSSLSPSIIKGDIRFKDVSFSYPTRSDISVLRRVSLDFPSGSNTAIVGPSGAGKSSIVSLIERFYDVSSGSIELDGVDLRELNVKWLRGNIGLVSQEPVLLATTIGANISMGLLGTPLECIPREEKFRLIEAAAAMANASAFIAGLPDGYSTLVGEGGIQLSGGQKQRIAIARAVVADPKILILDEATSALDPRAEREVQKALDGITRGRTTVTISHRLSTVRDADNIVVIEAGVVVEMGKHDELVQLDGTYAQLIKNQRLHDRVGEEEKVSMERQVIDRGGVQLPEMIDTMISKNSRGEVSSTENEFYNDENILSSLSSLQASPKEPQPVPIHGATLDERYPDRQYGLWYLIRRVIALRYDILRRYSLASIFAILTGFVLPFFSLIFAQAIVSFQDENKVSGKLGSLGDRTGLFYLLLAIYGCIFCGMEHYLFGGAGERLTAYLRSKTFYTLLCQDVPFYDSEKHNAGALISRLSDGPQKVGSLIGSPLGQILQCITTLLAGPIIGLIFNWKIGLVAAVTLPLLVSSGYIRLKVIVLKAQQNKAEHQLSAQIACEAVSSFKTIASLVAEDDRVRAYSESLEMPLRRSNRITPFTSLIYALSVSMQYPVNALVFWYGSMLLSNGEVSPFAFLACFFNIVYGGVQVSGVFAFTREISSAITALNDLVNIWETKPYYNSKSLENEDIPQDEKVPGDIVFRDVHFSYPARPSIKIMDGFNIRIEPGTHVALVGPSGCGKSTLIQLLYRFYEPDQGMISLGGVGISKYDLKAYRTSISIVSQEPTLYSGTIRYNVAIGATKPESEVADTEIEKVCQDANILDFIKSLPDGLDTQVGSKGSQLSGGQKQRIAIARALIRNPQILILDEATSALDSISERLIQESVQRITVNRTCITVAHRLSTVRNADCIYFIKGGRVSESGNHEELMAKRGDYYLHHLTLTCDSK